MFELELIILLLTLGLIERLKLWLPQNLSFLAKTCATGRASKTELLLVISDVMVICKLKLTKH